MRQVVVGTQSFGTILAQRYFPSKSVLHSIRLDRSKCSIDRFGHAPGFRPVVQRDRSPVYPSYPVLQRSDSADRDYHAIARV